MTKVKAKAAADKKKPAKPGKAALAAPRPRKQASAGGASSRAGKGGGGKDRRPAAKKAVGATARARVAKPAASGRRPAPKATSAARKPIGKVAAKKAAPSRKAPVTKKAAPKKVAAKAKVAPKKATKLIAKKPVAKKTAAKKVAPAARRPLQKPAAKAAAKKVAPKTAPKARPIVKPAAKAPVKKMLPAKKTAAPLSKPKAARPARPAARRKLKPSTKVAVERPSAFPPPSPDGVPAVPLRRPQVETPTAVAQSLAVATARLSARRVRDLMPVRIQTRRLVLRAPIRGDVPELVKLADNRNIAEKLSTLPSPYTRADGIAFVEIISQRPDERPYAMTLEGVFIGVVGISFPANQPPELGYWLGEPHWGQGYMQEAVRAVIDAAHQTREFPLIRSRALADNAASLHVLEQMGFKRADKYKETDGRFKDKTIIVLELEQPRWTLV